VLSDNSSELLKPKAPGRIKPTQAHGFKERIDRARHISDGFFANRPLTSDRF
jgi:hypothetical protein